MSQTWVEDLDADYDDAEWDDGEWDDADYDDAEDDDGEYDDAEAARRRRRRRSRRARGSRGRRRPSARAVRPRTAAAAIRAVGADQKAAEDDLRKEIARLRSDGQRSTWVTVLSALVGQGLTLRPVNNPYLATAIRSAPLVALPMPRGRGAASLLTSPQAIGVAGMFGLAFLGSEINKDKLVVPTSIKVENGATVLVSAQVVTAAGAPVPGATFTYTSAEPKIASITGNNEVKGEAIGWTTITVTASTPGAPSAIVDVEVTTP